MNALNKEFWIWTELLAFDNTQADLGVGEYLGKVGRCPDGICVMIGHPDFVFRHDGMGREYKLLRAFCSRHGHDRNTFRFRQEWTNYQLRDLVNRLKNAGIKVFLSIFGHNLGNRLHLEWLNEYLRPEWVGILPDGRNVHDIFIANLRQVMLDYGFTGWHGADGTAGAEAFNGEGMHITQEFFELFLKNQNIPMADIPEEYRSIDNHDFDARIKRSDWIWKNHRRQWQDFYSERMDNYLLAMSKMLHSIGRLHMQNSCWAKSPMETWFYFGIDDRILNKAKIDYLLLESVATSCSLIYGTKEYPCRDHHVYCCEEEMAAALPDTKIITMAGVCDPVESFNSLKHAPNMLERDIYCCANQNILTADGERRIADGLLICLGDNLTAPDWKRLWEHFDQAFGFQNLGNEGYTWLYSDRLYNRLKDDYILHGTYAPYIPTGELALRAVMLSCVCRSENLDAAVNRPLFVPDFDLLPEDEYQKVLARKSLTVLMGNLANVKLPENATVVAKTETLNGYILGLVLLNGKYSAAVQTIASVPQHFDVNEFFNNVGSYIPYMKVNPSFWDLCAEVMRGEIFHPFTGPGFALISRTSDNCRRVVIGSECDRYYIPEFKFEKKDGHEINFVSDYVCTDPAISDENKLVGAKARDCYNNIFVPPRGILVFDDKTE